MPLVKPDMTNIWASGGAVVKPSDVKIQTGWTPEVPPHQWENWVQKRQDEYLAHINQRGIPAWDGLTNYEASGLSYVQGSDGGIYKSVAASGPAGVVQNPTTDVVGTYWVKAFITQTDGDIRYLQVADNLSDVNNAVTAFNNIKQVASTTVSGVVELATTAEVLAGTSTNLAVTPEGLVSGLLGTATLSGTGFAQIPVKVLGIRSNLYIAWGTVTTAAGTVAATYSSPFPNATLTGITTATVAGISTAFTSTGSPSQATILAHVSSTGIAASTDVRYIAIGR
jgi:hypothetical protein